MIPTFSSGSRAIPFRKNPVPVLHIDTTYEFPQMVEFRDWAIKHYNLNLIVEVNTEARERGIGYETQDQWIHGSASVDESVAKFWSSIATLERIPRE